MKYHEEEHPKYKCKLCAGESTVLVIPNGLGHNDSQADECPWCLRREVNQLNKDKEEILKALKDLNSFAYTLSRSFKFYEDTKVCGTIIAVINKFNRNHNKTNQ